MKNVILTHNELQLNMFLSFAEGLRKGLELPSGHFFTPQHNKQAEVFSFEVWKSATKPEHGDATCILKHTFGAGECQMNDHRLWVTIRYMADQSLKFIESVKRTFDPLAVKPAGPILGQVYYPASEKPRKENDGSSVSVLIDLTGEKKYYCVGWYNYEQNCWRSLGEDAQEMIQNTEYKMLWRYID